MPGDIEFPLSPGAVRFFINKEHECHAKEEVVLPDTSQPG